VLPKLFFLGKELLLRCRLYIGSQADPAVHEKIVQDAQRLGQYDIIIDDGSHIPTMQLETMKGLWQALKPGGIYVIEDVALVYRGKWAGRNDTFMSWAKRQLDLLHCRSGPRYRTFSEVNNQTCAAASEMERQVLSVDCMSEACVVTKYVWPGASSR
jgi:hypothetical protein